MKTTSFLSWTALLVSTFSFNFAIAVKPPAVKPPHAGPDCTELFETPEVKSLKEKIKDFYFVVAATSPAPKRCTIQSGITDLEISNLGQIVSPVANPKGLSDHEVVKFRKYYTSSVLKGRTELEKMMQIKLGYCRTRVSNNEAPDEVVNGAAKANHNFFAKDIWIQEFRKDEKGNYLKDAQGSFKLFHKKIPNSGQRIVDKFMTKTLNESELAFMNDKEASCKLAKEKLAKILPGIKSEEVQTEAVATSAANKYFDQSSSFPSFSKEKLVINENQFFSLNYQSDVWRPQSQPRVSNYLSPGPIFYLNPYRYDNFLDSMTLDNKNPYLKEKGNN